ncbi:hypothetical protein ACOCEA_00715 [Maribacter sp. CXY002]|uniref:hypothetical protein n=1 Tax=Maribacter luteocoastalis TaxID=3407671 RepID=UPI003B6822C9
MYQVNNTIQSQSFNKLQVEKIAKNDNLEVLSISLEKDFIFPEHTSSRDALLILLEGDINFNINEENYRLKKHQELSFPKHEKHWVKANENSKFLIIR